MDIPAPEPAAPQSERAGPAQGADDYPPIGDYAVIGDCRTAALVSRAGSIDWLCLPHFSGASVFAAILDRRRGGSFAVRPSGPFSAQRRYVDDTNVLETTFQTPTGVLRLTDLMALPASDGGGLEPKREVLRIAECLSGEVEIAAHYEPRPGFAATPVRLRRCGRLGWTCMWGCELLLLNADMPLQPRDASTLTGRATLRAGERRHFSLAYVRDDIAIVPLLGAAAEKRLDHTVDWWRRWAARCTYRGPWRRQVIRSALTLKLLTFSLSGAVVAAPTTSLPEAIGGSRNWDYRYCWLRDASLTLEAFVDLGYQDEGAAFLGWLLRATRLTQPELQVLYDVYGEAVVPERELDHLEGHRCSRPVRVGNGAWHQLQLDVYGAVVLAAAAFVRRGGRLDYAQRRLLAAFGDVVCRKWRRPDHGIWEVRGEPRHYTYSKLMCWAALDCLTRLAEQGHLPVPRDRFRNERAAIRATIDSRSFSRELDSYVGIFDSRELDASLLLMPRYGYLGADHPRMRSTFEHIRGSLEDNGLYHRYTPEFDPLGRESAFGICSFWAVDYLHRAGRHDEAARAFERLLAAANDLGLYAEEIEVASDALVGNFPQGFTHIGLINAALTMTGWTGRALQERSP